MARVGTTWLDSLLAAVAEAGGLMWQLQPMLAEPDGSGPDTGTIGRHAPASREPWSMQVASAYWDLYFGAGEVYRDLRAAAGLALPLFNDVHGPDALDMVRNMAPAASEQALRDATRTLDRLISHARAVPGIDEGEEWAPLPHPAPPCPYCHTYGLRMLRRKGEVRCFLPGCTDSDGNPTRARMEPGRMTGEERLIFGDGTTMGGGA